MNFRRVTSWFTTGLFGATVFVWGVTGSLGQQGQTDESSPSPAAFNGLTTGPDVRLSVGAATTSIPIAVPAGHKNLTPNLALHYMSGGGASPYGVGWALPLARIERDPRFGAPGCPDPGEAEYRFVLSTPQGSIPCRLEPTTGRCQPEVEGSFLRIRYLSDSNSWEVWEKNGTVHRFGEVETARVFNGGPRTLFSAELVYSFGDEFDWLRWRASADCTWTGAWAITSITDLNSNRVEFEYEPGLLPSSIRWGGNATGGAPVDQVRFVWESRPRQEAVTLNFGGISLVVDRRLSEIRVEALRPLAPIRVYRLDYHDELYTQSPSRGRVWVLRAVQLIGSDGNALTRADGLPAATVFHYSSHDLSATGQADSFGFHSPGTRFEFTGPFSAQERKDVGGGNRLWVTTSDVLDLNGDAFPDSVWVWKDEQGRCFWQVRYNFSSVASQWTALPVCALFARSS